MNTSMFASTASTIAASHAAQTPSNAQPTPASSEKLEKFAEFMEKSSDVIDATLTGLGVSEGVRTTVGAIGSLPVNGIRGIQASRKLIAEVNTFGGLRRAQKSQPQNFLDERARLQWEVNKFDSKAKIAGHTFEIFSQAYKAGKTVTELSGKIIGPFVEQALSSTDNLLASAALLHLTGAAGAIAAAAPIVGGAVVVLGVSMGIAALAKFAAERASKRRADQLAALGPPAAGPSASQIPGDGPGPPGDGGPPATQFSQSTVPAAASGAGSTTPAATAANNSRSTNVINTDPETMRTVSAALKTFSEDIDAAKQALQQAVNSASDSWGDDVYEHTESTVEDILSRIAPGEDCSELANHIDTKATALEEYNS